MKPIYRSSHLVNYSNCPKKFNLSTKKDTETTAAMRNGLLFEGYVFGFKDKEAQIQLEGRKHKKTLDAMKVRAEKIRDKYKFDGVPFNKLQIEFEEFIVQGEYDFIGKSTLSDNAIVDLKFTNDIDKNWNYRNSKEEFLQAAMYPMLESIQRNGGELNFSEPIDFFYLIVENNDYTEPLVKELQVKVTESDLNWMWGKILQIHKARGLGYPANESLDNCLGSGAYSARCYYLEHCEEGRSIITIPKHSSIRFNQLNTNK